MDTDYENKSLYIEAEERLWLTKSGDRLVPDGHPEAYRLYCVPRQLINRLEYERLKQPKRGRPKKKGKADGDAE